MALLPWKIVTLEYGAVGSSSTPKRQIRSLGALAVEVDGIEETTAAINPYRQTNHLEAFGVLTSGASKSFFWYLEVLTSAVIGSSLSVHGLTLKR